MEDLNVENGLSNQEDYTVKDQQLFTKVHNVCNINKNFVFEIGMKFGSEEESYNAYNSYAVEKGFGVRKGVKAHNRNKEITRCLFLCSCEGKSSKLSPYEERKRKRLEYRCGCMARIKFRISNGIWEVCEFNDMHSHPMIEDNLRHFIQSGRKLTDATKNILGSMTDAGIRTKKAVRYLQNEAGGIENAGFIEQDAHNFIQSYKRNMIRSGDAQTLVNHFMHLQSEDSNFFYSFQVDEDGRLCNFFWRDSISEFVKHYEQRAADMRDIEANEDYKCRGKPKIPIEDCGILKHAASVYTRKIYTRFEYEFLQCATKKVITVETNETCSKYRISKGESEQIETVQFNSLDNSIVCSCHMFESMGWLCCHALRVLFFNLNFPCIPEQYILKRWTKNARHGNGFEEYTKKETSKSSMSIRLNGLMKEAFAVMTLAANDVDSEKIARKYLYQANVEITRFQSKLYAEGRDKGVHKFNSIVDPCQDSKDIILDPIKKKGKGKGYKRLKPNIEKGRKKASQKTLKDKVGHPNEQQSFSTMASTVNAQSSSMSQINSSFEFYGESSNTFTQLLTQDSTLWTTGYNQNRGLNNIQSNIGI